MFRILWLSARVALLFLAFCCGSEWLLQGEGVAQAQQRGRTPGYGSGVYKWQIVPNWFADNTRFWYRNDLPEQTKEFILVDAAAGKREKAFDHDKLAAALSKTSNKEYKANRLPFDTIEFVNGNSAIEFTVDDVRWTCNLSNYEVARKSDKTSEPTDKASDKTGKSESKPEKPADHAKPQIISGDGSEAPFDPEAILSDAAAPQAQDAGSQTRRGFRGGNQEDRGPRGADRNSIAQSPDKKWTASIRDSNIFLRGEDGNETKLTDDGKSEIPYTHLNWSPDSATLVAFRLERGDHKEVYRVESSPMGVNGATGGGVGRAVLHQSEYPLPGDKLDSYELNVFNVESKKQFKPLGDERIDMNADGGDPVPVFGNNGFATLRWNHDGAHFTLEKYDRGHQRVRLIDVNAATGETRNIIDERSKTFIWTAHFEGLNLRMFNYLHDEGEMIYASEMSGWRHLYLVDTATGTMKPITRGGWVVRGVNRIDEDARQIWFMASGVLPDQDPYFIQYGRVNFDGTGLTWLTSGNGFHLISFGRMGTNGFPQTFPRQWGSPTTGSFSPDMKYVIDSYSRVDLSPITELRRATDGQFICVLEKSEVTADWTAPEVFVTKGRDGETDIWGLIFRPKNFDPVKKYPVIEDIYAGPQGSFVPKTFSTGPRYQDLTDLGFIVVKIDGMGTANRSKAFHDVCWHNLKDAGFPDRIAWIKEAAKKYPYMDLDRVGIYGTSAGGQNAAAAVLFHPEFYKVAVANSGCHDNRMDKVSWNEQWMGYPVGPQYSECSNIDNANRLQGHLQLVVGELDTNVPPESTYRFVNALVKAKKDFDFVLIPGANHGADSPITHAKLRDFFVRYLQNVEPANRNAPVTNSGTASNNHS